MRKTIALFILLVLSVAVLAWGSTSASNEKTAITAVAQNYMDAYYTADAARMQKTLHPDFHKRTIQTVNGHTEISEDTVQSMIEAFDWEAAKKFLLQSGSRRLKFWTFTATPPA